MVKLQTVKSFFVETYKPLIRDLGRLPSVAKFVFTALAEPSPSKEARVQQVNKLLGEEAAKNPLKRIPVSQFIRALKLAHPEKLTDSNIERGQLPLPLQAAIKYMAKEGSEAGQQELVFPEEVLKIITDACNKKRTSTGKNQGSISYEDYYENYDQFFSNGDVIKNAYNPAYQLGRTLGRFSYEFTEEGTLKITDIFNFNDVNKSNGEKRLWPLITPFMPEMVLALRGQLNTPTGLESAGLTGAILLGNPYVAARKFLPYLGKPFHIDLTIPLEQ